MPIVGGKYVNPGWVNNSPPALSASEMNAISDTLEQLSQGGGNGPSVPCIVVGTSAGGADTSMCQYVCTGTHDELTIAQADQYAVQRNLPLCFMPGDYNLENTLTLNSNMVFGWNRPMSSFGTGMSTLVRKNITVQKSVIFKGTVMQNVAFDIDSSFSYTEGNIELSLESGKPQVLDGINIQNIMGTGIKGPIGGFLSYVIRNIMIGGNQETGAVGLNLFGTASTYTDSALCVIENSIFETPVNLSAVGGVGSGSMEMWIHSSIFNQLNLNSASQMMISGNSIQELSLSNTIPDRSTSNVVITSNGIESSITVGENCEKIYIVNNIGIQNTEVTIVDNSGGGVTVANNYNFAS